MERLTVLLALMALDAGGAETHVVSLAKQLKKRGVEVIVASHGGKLTKALETSGIKHYTLPLDRKSPLNLIYSVNGLANIVKEHEVNVIHAHARIPAWVSQWVSFMTGCPYITTSHGIYSTGWGMGLITTWGRKVIAVSEDVKKHLINGFKVNPDKIFVIPNGIDLERFNPNIDSSQVERQLGLMHEDLKIVYVSRLMGARGEIALRLIEALPQIEKTFPNVKLIVVGEGDKYESIARMAAEYNSKTSENNVVVTGARLDTPLIMNMADVAVGVGRVALEAMAMEKPVIIAGEAGFMGILNPDNFEIAKKHNFSGRGSDMRTDADNIAKSIKELLSDIELRKKLGAFGRQKVARYFSIETMTDEVLNVYHQVIEEGKNELNR
ncbi:Glycosyl transferase group 1 [Tepidanaerobacter acetatoxydans Re1]|uniref:Glycosyl transferase group 1 n=1 Tax=Tepidanaerobacter acetatoxydans (strain DSM 21804 / JCM 16047 / Re1) TaxID=1209989 RepID=F4LWU1_TEPAE|nr:glycosyltransferase family 4 protein [Tepidanaerobacter acetatoxydans]AEE91813.1 glycosyl transferase group 1 [Tepidanaerobacter acetatoxydans Re1]CCP26606.1 Glycosyl transferase group 1 [Tepidanaerobacter acetatoxydans Re1]